MVCLIATRGENETADMFDAALQRRGVKAFWMTPGEVLDDVAYGVESTLSEECERGADASALIAGLCQVATGSRLHEADAVLSCAGDFARYFDSVRVLFEALGVVTLNTAAATRVSADKWQTHVALAEAGVPVAAAMLVHDNAEAHAAAGELGYPVVVKEPHGFGGYGVRKADNGAELRAAFEELHSDGGALMIEHYIECDGRDLRLLVLEGKVLGAFHRVAPAGEFRSNLTLGGTGTAAQVGRPERRLAKAATRALGLDWVGLDVGRATRTIAGRSYLPEGALFVFETNSTPGIDGLFTYGGPDVSDEIVDCLMRRCTRRPVARRQLAAFSAVGTVGAR